MRCPWVRAPLALLKTERLRAAQEAWIWEVVTPTGIEYHGGWQPGLNTGSFLDARAAPPQIQARVLIANGYLNLKRLSPALCTTVWSCLSPGGPAVVKNFADRLASKLLGVSHSMARRIHDGLRESSWDPAVGEAEAGAGDCSGEAFSRAVGQAERALRSLWALEVRVREAMSVAHYGHADLAYERAMNRLQQHGLQLGTK